VAPAPTEVLNGKGHPLIANSSRANDNRNAKTILGNRHNCDAVFRLLDRRAQTFLRIFIGDTHQMLFLIITAFP